jgi:hypothetical protein
VLQLETFDRGEGDFPLVALDRARTVGDLVALVDHWVHRDTQVRAEITSGVSLA